MHSYTGQLGTVLSGPANVVPGLAPSAALKAKRCYFPRSSWVHAFILTCDDKLAVWFKRGVHHVHGMAVGGVPGVCCLYPQSNQQLYDLAVTWWSAGHFVHRFLYRILGYTVAAPPKVPCGSDCPPGVVVSCCSNALPATLHVTPSNQTGTCGLGPWTLTWNGSVWDGSDTNGNNWALLCSGGGSDCTRYRLTSDSYDGAHLNVAPNAGCSCSPLLLVFDATLTGGPAPCSGNVRLTVTQ